MFSDLNEKNFYQCDQLEGHISSLVAALSEAPITSTLRAVHRLLTAQNLLHKGCESNFNLVTNQVEGGQKDWQSYGLAVAHALSSTCLYPDVSLKFPHSATQQGNTKSSEQTRMSPPSEDSKPPNREAADHSLHMSHAAASSHHQKEESHCVDLPAMRSMEEDSDVQITAPLNLQMEHSSGFIVGQGQTSHTLPASKRRSKPATDLTMQECEDEHHQQQQQQQQQQRAETSNSSSASIVEKSKVEVAKSPTTTSKKKSRKESILDISFGNNTQLRDLLKKNSSKRKLFEDGTHNHEDSTEKNQQTQAVERLVYSVRVRSIQEITQRENPLRWWQLHPERDIRVSWDVTMFFMLAYTLVALPLRICFMQLHFDYPYTGWVLENVVNGLFVLDMGVNCVTGVYEKPEVLDAMNEKRKSKKKLGKENSETMKDSGDQSRSSFVRMNSVGSSEFIREVNRFRTKKVLTYEPQLIVGQYLRGWFVIDLVSVLPWEQLMQLVFQNSAALASAPRLLKLLRLIRLVKLLRMYRLRRLMKSIKKVIPPTAMELLKLSIFVGILAHYVACGFYYVAVMQNEAGDGTWLENYFDQKASVDHISAGKLYLTSMYWGFTTTSSVGYGDVTPANTYEKLYAMIVMYTGVVMMSGITGKLTAVLSQFGAPEAQARMKMDSVDTYCKYRNLPVHLIKSVTEYFEMTIAAKAECDEAQILKEMSPALRAQVVCHIFRNIVEVMPFFRGCSDLFLSAVVMCMEPIMYAPSDIVIQKGQRELAMYVLAKGRAAVIDARGKVMRELDSGDFFGEFGLFFGVRRTATICSITFADIFRLDQERFKLVQDMYPDMQERVQVQAEYMFKKTIVCYLCGQAGHVSVQCTVPRNDDEDDTNQKVPLKRTWNGLRMLTRFKEKLLGGDENAVKPLVFSG